MNIEPTTHQKICKLKSCNKEFTSSREWQNFCSKEHYNEHWKRQKAEDRAILKAIRRTNK